jgi:hypothetical protein
VENGYTYDISVMGTYLRSCYGVSLEDLVATSTPFRFTPYSKPPEVIPESRPERSRSTSRTPMSRSPARSPMRSRSKSPMGKATLKLSSMLFDDNGDSFTNNPLNKAELATLETDTNTKNPDVVEKSSDINPLEVTSEAASSSLSVIISQRLNVPKEMWRLMDALWSLGAMKVVDIFSVDADENEVIALLYMY